MLQDDDDIISNLDGRDVCLNKTLPIQFETQIERKGSRIHEI